MKKVFLINGKAKQGKTTIANIIKNYYTKKGSKVVLTSFAKYLKMYAMELGVWDGKEETKPRAFLQNIGIELIKNKIDPKFLINRALQDLEVYDHYVDIVIIHDARFIEEINAIKNKYDTISIAVLGENNNLSIAEKNHITETALNNYYGYDYQIHNNFDKAELISRIENILSEVQI